MHDSFLLLRCKAAARAEALSANSGADRPIWCCSCGENAYGVF